MNPVKVFSEVAPREIRRAMILTLPREARRALQAKLPADLGKRIKKEVLPSKRTELFVDLMLQFLENSGQENLVQELIYEWLVRHNAPMLREALTFLGIKHDQNGIITDPEFETKDFELGHFPVEKNQALFSHLVDYYDRDAVRIYMHFLHCIGVD